MSNPTPSTPSPAWEQVRKMEEAESGVPLEIRRELMECAVSNGCISYHWLCELWKRGFDAGHTDGYVAGLDESSGDPRVERIEAGFEAIRSATNGEYCREDMIVTDALQAGRDFAVRLARREQHIQQLISERDAARAAEASQNAEAHGYLSRLFTTVAPQCRPSEHLLILCTQIDNYIAGRIEQVATLSAQAAELQRHADERGSELDAIASLVSDRAEVGTYAKVAGQIAELTNERDRWESAYRQMDDSEKAFRAQVADLSAQVKELKIKIAGYSSSTARLQHRRDELKATVAQLTQEKKLLERELTDQVDERLEISAQLAQLRQQGDEPK